MGRLATVEIHWLKSFWKPNQPVTNQDSRPNPDPLCSGVRAQFLCRDPPQNFDFWIRDESMSHPSTLSSFYISITHITYFISHSFQPLYTQYTIIKVNIHQLHYGPIDQCNSDLFSPSTLNSPYQTTNPAKWQPKLLITYCEVEERKKAFQTKIIHWWHNVEKEANTLI